MPRWGNNTCFYPEDLFITEGVQIFLFHSGDWTDFTDVIQAISESHC